MKVNTETFVLYGGDRNIELAEQAAEPLATITDDQWLVLSPMTIDDRRQTWAAWQSPSTVTVLAEGDGG